MEETVCHGCTVIMRQHAGAAHSECIGQNGNRHGRHNDNECSPEPVILQPTETFSRTWRISGGRMTEICEDYCQRDESHERADAATSLDHFKLLGIERV